MKVKAIPEQFTPITPYLIVSSAPEAVLFYERAFGAKESNRMEAGGKVMHTEVRIEGAPIMLADEFPEEGFKSPIAYGGTPAFVHLYVEDVDQVFEKAVSEGAEVLMPVSDQFFGDRHGILKDPFGHIWTVATHIEDVSQEELDKRIAEYTTKEHG